MRRSDRFATLKRKQTPLKAGPPLQEPDGVDETARDRSLDVDEAILFQCYQKLQDLSNVISNNVLYGWQDEWPESDKFHIKQRCVSLTFATLPDFITKALNIS